MAKKGKEKRNQRDKHKEHEEFERVRRRDTRSPVHIASGENNAHGEELTRFLREPYRSRVLGKTR